MSNLEKLIAKGAQVVGGDLLLRHKTVGRFRNNDFLVTEDGLAELQVIDVVVKPAPAPEAEQPAPKAEQPKATRRRAPPASPKPAPTIAPLTDDVDIDVE
jgi:hypothetical protein